MPDAAETPALKSSSTPVVGQAGTSHFSTRGIPQADVIDAWNQAFSDFSDITFQAHEFDEFHGEFRLGLMGDLSFAYVRMGPCVVERARPAAENEAALRVAFVFMQRGGAELRHCGRTSVLSAGDIVLCDAAEPMTCRFADGATIIVVRSPALRLSDRLPNRQRLNGRPLRRGLGLTDTLFAMTQSLNTLLDEQTPAFAARAISSHFLDFMATAYGLAYGYDLVDPEVATSRRLQVLNYIECNLHDPNLSPHSIATALGVSPRRLYTIMLEVGESANAYILRRRLEECAKQLAAPEKRRRQRISEIALASGFKSDAYFSRVFKHKFGMTARDYRRLHAPMSSAD